MGIPPPTDPHDIRTLRPRQTARRRRNREDVFGWRGSLSQSLTLFEWGMGWGVAVFRGSLKRGRRGVVGSAQEGEWGWFWGRWSIPENCQSMRSGKEKKRRNKFPFLSGVNFHHITPKVEEETRRRRRLVPEFPTFSRGKEERKVPPFSPFPPTLRHASGGNPIPSHTKAASPPLPPLSISSLFLPSSPFCLSDTGFTNVHLTFEAPVIQPFGSTANLVLPPSYFASRAHAHNIWAARRNGWLVGWVFVAPFLLPPPLIRYPSPPLHARLASFLFLPRFLPTSDSLFSPPTPSRHKCCCFLSRTLDLALCTFPTVPDEKRPL